MAAHQRLGALSLEPGPLNDVEVVPQPVRVLQLQARALRADTPLREHDDLIAECVRGCGEMNVFLVRPFGDPRMIIW